MKITKTNAARLLDKAGISYELIPYEVDPENLAATHVAESWARILSEYSKRWYYGETETEFLYVSYPEIWRSTSKLLLRYREIKVPR